MESKTIMVCIVVTMLGIAALVAGFAAEAKRVKNPTIQVYYIGFGREEVECIYPSSPVVGLAIAATIALFLARVIITSTTGGCCSCCKMIPKLSGFARVCIVISWVTSFAAVVIFAAGAKLSTQKGAQRGANGDYYCYIVRRGIFSAAAIMSLASVLFALVYYLSYVSAINGIAETKALEVEVEAPPIKDANKAPIGDDKNEKPKKPSQKR